MMRASRTEHGFTLVEVIVAAFIVLLVSATAFTMLASSSSGDVHQKLKAEQTAMAENVVERFRTDLTWMEDCAEAFKTGQKQCDVSFHFTEETMPELAGEDGTYTFRIGAIATGTDDETDGTGEDDRDGQVPDYWTVIITTSQDLLDALPPMTSTLVINPEVSSNQGRLRVQACGIWPQVDERVAIASCPMSQEQRIKPPPGFLVEKPGKCDSDECDTWVCAHTDYFSGYCDAGRLDEYPGHDHHLDVRIYPIETSFVLEGADASTQGIRIESETDPQGEAILNGLPAGQYKVTFSAPPNMVPWRSHSIPGDGFATVETGLESRVLQAFQPAPRPFDVTLRTIDISVPWDNVVIYGLRSQLCFRLVPAPFARAEYPDKAACAPKGAEELRSIASPGLYLAEMVRGDNPNTRTGLRNTPGYVWIDPLDDSKPTSRPPDAGLSLDLQAIYQQNYCAESVRQTLYETYGATHVVDGKTYTIKHCNGDKFGEEGNNGSEPGNGGGGGGSSPPPKPIGGGGGA